MSKYFLINISGTGPGGAVSIYLTSNGLVGGRRCKTEIPNADLLLTPNVGNTTICSDGQPFTEFPLTAGKGRPFDVRIEQNKTTVYDDLKELIDFVDADPGATLRLTAAGEPGNIDVDFRPNHSPIPLGFGTFSTDYIKAIVIRGITTAFN